MNTAALYSRINELGALLRAAGMAHGVDVWLSVARLLKQLEERGKLPKDEKDLAPLLGPLLCRNPEEQARFPVLFEQWLNHEKLPVLQAVNRTAAPGRDALLTAQAATQKTQKYWVMGGIVLFICLLAVLITKGPDWFWPKPIPVTSKVKPPEGPEKSEQLIPRRKPQPTAAPVTIIDRIEPRPQPQPDYIQQDWQHVVRNIGWVLFALPWLPVVGFLAWRYRRNAVLRRQSASADDLLRHFHFDRVLQPFFGGAQTEQALRELYAARQEPTQRLHISATVDATARNGGYFQPVYRNRRIAPEHVLLVRSQHRNDQQAALAEELKKRFKALGLPINTYRFRDDPRWLVQWGDDSGQAKYYQLHQLAARHEGARLLIISETAILFHPYSGEIRSWLNDFTAWQDKVWLQPRDAGNAHAALLAQHRFLMLPLTQDNLPQLVDHLTKPQPHKLMPRPPQTLPLPVLIAAEPDAWLGERPPYGADLQLLLRQLEQFLEPDGLRLLRAVAIYPKPHWSLTRALDYLLFGSLNTPTLIADPPQRREQRLARLSRLPWLTHAYLPDWLREALLLGMDRHERAQVAAVWQRLFGQLTNRNSPQSLTLDVRIPPKLQLQVKFDDWRAISSDDAINDPIFANIVRGGKLGLLDFRIPQALAKLLPQNNQSLLLRPGAIALLWALLGSGSLYAVWHCYGQHAFIDYQRNQQMQHNAQWPVTLSYHPDTQALMTALQNDLEAWQFKVTPRPGGDETTLKSGNTIRYPVDAQAVAQRIMRNLTWLTYGAPVALVPAGNSAEPTIQVELNRTYQQGTAFNDELRMPEKPRLLFEPEMVRIPSGKFMMGSKDGEQPMHEVTIAYAFEIGKYEVTFDEYDAFAKDAKRELPDDRGWGRGKRPVINVSWNDAQAYVQWLSRQTGKKYRLPTEAEWEYATRSGSQTRYWWGDDIGQNNAVCSGCGSEWDGQQTAPVGSFKANMFGLYDTAGNVWEWTQDCWHDNYNNAPSDGSAWLEKDGRNCSRRVARSGSWGNRPQNLRSANRDRNNIDVTNIYLGFRIARDF
ncbi:MAG: formylglycine-generating enzyme family protein [Proteobacteria bacterium]|nr:formylglycine-generating enzyme family protein [Pseudomonadota bacterium]